MKAYKLYKLDYECPEIIGYFKTENKAYKYIKRINPEALIINKDKISNNQNIENKYGIEQIKILEQDPTTYIIINIHYDDFNKKIEIEKSYLTEDKFIKYNYKETENITNDSIYICKKIENNFNEKKYIKNQKELLKEKLKNTDIKIEADGILYEVKDFWENIVEISPTEQNKYRNKKTGKDFKEIYKKLYKINENNELEEIETLEF